MKMDVDGDTFLWAEIEKLVKEHKIETIVETGTYLGNTAKKFATIADVITCEVKREHFDEAMKNLATVPNALVFFGNSVDVLSENAGLFKNKRVLFFLDAHWYDYCPLLDELKLIETMGMKPIVVIHDFKVPGKDFGYDRYRGQDFEWSLIDYQVRKIYGKDGFTYYYNENSDGPRRGAIFILPVTEKV